MLYAVQGTALLKANCDPYNYPSQAAKPKPCIYGAVKSKRTIVIFGDLHGELAPALNKVGKALGYRVAAFEFAGCITSFVPPTPGQALTGARTKACNLWHTTLPAAVQLKNR